MHAWAVTSDTQPATPARAGRPRDEAAGRAILDAVRGLLAEHGYSALTIEAVAARAGVAKTTVYRRWSSKADLVVDAVVDSLGPLLRPDEAATRALSPEAALRLFVQAFSTVEARAAYLALIGEAAASPALHADLQLRLVEPSRRLIARCARPDATAAEIGLVHDVIVGAVVHRLLVRQQPADDAFLHGLLTLVAPLADQPADRLADPLTDPLAGG